MLSIRIGFLLLSALTALPAQDNSLKITTVSPLPPAISGAAYYQVLTATGGSPPYSWAVVTGALPPGLTLAQNGTITGSSSVQGTSPVTVQVADNAGARVNLNLLLAVIAGATVSRFGVVPHLAAGDTWNTTITLANSSAQSVPVRVNFYTDEGGALSLPLSVAQQGSSQTFTAAGLDVALNPNTSIQISTGSLPALVTGWAEVLSPGPLAGFAVFRTVPPSGGASECTVPLQTQTPSSVVLPYDNGTGYVMGVAFANASPDRTVLTATVWDENGTQLDVQSLSVPGKGHTAFVMPSQLPSTTGKRGIVRFQGTGTAGIAAIGLRFSPYGTFTSVPVF